MLTIHTALRMGASAACQRKHPIAGKIAVTGTCRELPICTLFRHLSRTDTYAGAVTASEPAASVSNPKQTPMPPGKPVRTAAFFDLDKTVIAKSSTLAFSKPFFDQGLINRRAVLKSTYAQFLFLMSGADHDQMDRMRSYITNMCTGRDVVVVSASGEEIVAPIARALGATHAMATRMVVEDGRYTGEIAFYCYGEGKVEAIRQLAAREGYALEHCYAYS